MDAPNLPRSYEPNPALRVLYRWFFDNIQVDEEWVRQVRRLSNRGTVVYVLRNLNPVDFLALDHLTKRYDLPRVRFVSDLPWGVAHPLRSNILSRFPLRRQRTPPQQLRAALAEGGSAALFLKRPPSVLDVAS